jgi:hypothetical protein
MKRSHARSLIFTYIYLAVGCVTVGTAMTFLLLFACRYFGIDVLKNPWLLAIPPVFSLILNVLSIELYYKISKR